MMIYYLLITVTLFFSFFHYSNIRQLAFEHGENKSLIHNGLWYVSNLKVSRGTISMNMLFVIFLFVAGLRATTVGKDVQQYKLIFQLRNSYEIMDSVSGVEPLFQLFNKAVGFFIDDFQVVLFLSSLFGLMDSRMDENNGKADTSDDFVLYRINKKVREELDEQRIAGKEFLSDQEIDDIISRVLEEKSYEKNFVVGFFVCSVFLL